MIHYLKNKVGVVDFANAQGVVMFKDQGPDGPRTLKFYHSAGFCKIYYSHFNFEVMKFLSKIQINLKICQIMVVFQKLDGKTTTFKFQNQKLEGKTTILNF